MKRSYVFLCWACGAGFLLIGLWLGFAGEDYHIWLDPDPIIAALERIP
jgi:hypothetical protein